MDMFDGFVFLEEKKKSLIPILCQYDFLSALTAAFSITSWRKNRGAQESCLALNSAMVENTEWGRKTIFTPNDLEEFFQLLYYRLQNGLFIYRTALICVSILIQILS